MVIRVIKIFIMSISVAGLRSVVGDVGNVGDVICLLEML
jgi:hypothetical protein